MHPDIIDITLPDGKKEKLFLAPHTLKAKIETEQRNIALHEDQIKILQARVVFYQELLNTLEVADE